MAARGQQQVRVDGRTIKVTNLDKVLYPETGTTKGEVIAYYQAVAPWLLPHASGRPATRKRWPNGVGTDADPGKPFFVKNLEAGAPTWLRTVTISHSDGDNVYPLIEDTATLVWLAQMAALELHVPQWQVDADGLPQHPDRLVLDLDPGPGVQMGQIVELAHLIRGVLDDVGFRCMPVTSGSKGVHLYAALDGTLTSDEASDLAQQLARSLEGSHPDLVVSDMKKSLREGRILLDWSQNNAAKTTIAPYSLRGRPHPTVAVPRTWDELTPDLRHLEFAEVLERLHTIGDPLATLRDAGPSRRPARSSRGLLRDHSSLAGSSGSAVAEERRGEESVPTVAEERRGVPRLEAADRLTTYRSMRDANKTPEPVPEAPPTPRGEGNSFVIQRHEARRLHWDVRLERDGVLVSWAVPKAPPTDPKVNHLAVQTEDHPLEYASFAGDIPKGEYGGGHVDIWDAGTYELEKWVDGREVIATLTGRPDGGLGGAPRKFAFIHTGHGGENKNWLMHLMEPAARRAAKPPRPSPASDATVHDPPLDHPDAQASGDTTSLDDLPVIEPMLASPGALTDARGEGWTFEAKWDGYRCVASVAGGEVALRSRRGLDLTRDYPELAELARLLSGRACILDGEVVVLDDAGRPRFELLQNHGNSDRKATYMAFDLLHLDGRSLIRTPYAERRAALAELLGAGGRRVHVPEDFGTDGETALAVSRDLGLEGVVAKQTDSVYQPGRRARTWVKVKHKLEAEVVIVGWAPGENSRAHTLGSLLVAVPDDDGSLVYGGRVGSGFSEKALREAREVLGGIETDAPPVPDVPRAEARGVHWVEPLLVAQITYGEWTSIGRFRHPVWGHWRPEMTPEDVRPMAEQQ